MDYKIKGSDRRTAFFHDWHNKLHIITNMIKDWSLEEVKNNIDKITYGANDARMDGFVTWGCKQDLYQILWYCEDALEKCSSYEGEEEFLKKREQQKPLTMLGRK